MSLSWVAVDFVTGRLLAYLPDATPQGPLRRTIGQYETNTITVPLTSAPVDWQVVTRPYATCLIALDNSTGNPVWGGVITQRIRGMEDSIQLPVATVESYFDRREISPLVSGTVITKPDYGYYSGWDQCALDADLVARYAQDGTKAGIPVRIDWQASTQPGRTQIYSDADDKTVYSGLQDLSGILNGPEWTVTWEWQHNPERITPVLTIADRIGSSPTAGHGPNAVFHMPGCVSAVTFVEDYSSGKGANDVTAVGPGQGNSRPSFRQVATSLGGRPTVEYRFNVPSTGQLTTAQIAALKGYATQALTYLGAGSQTVTLTADITDMATPVLGVDWNVGDDIGYRVAPFDGNGNPILAFPDGLFGTGRTIGVEFTDTTIAPIVWVPDPTLTAGSF